MNNQRYSYRQRNGKLKTLNLILLILLRVVLLVSQVLSLFNQGF